MLESEKLENKPWLLGIEECLIWSNSELALKTEPSVYSSRKIGGLSRKQNSKSVSSLAAPLLDGLAEIGANYGTKHKEPIAERPR